MRGAIPRAKLCAFTLVELVAGLAIVAILLALALPAYARFIAEHRLREEARRIADGITLARTEAIKRNGHVVICASSAAATCGSGTNWDAGWIMFADTDDNADVDAGDTLLGREQASPEGVTLRGNRPVAEYLRFNYLGQARTVTGALQMGTIEVCKSGLQGYRVVLANSGRARIERASGTCL
jgi:type IV fimbrial biogenesis protein FimT